MTEEELLKARFAAVKWFKVYGKVHIPTSIDECIGEDILAFYLLQAIDEINKLKKENEVFKNELFRKTVDFTGMESPILIKQLNLLLLYLYFVGVGFTAGFSFGKRYRKIK